MKSLLLFSAVLGFILTTNPTPKALLGKWQVINFENKQISESEKTILFTFLENGSLERSKKNDVLRKGTWKYNKENKELDLLLADKQEPETFKVLTLNNKLLRMADKNGTIIRLAKMKS